MFWAVVLAIAGLALLGLAVLVAGLWNAFTDGAHDE